MYQNRLPISYQRNESIALGERSLLLRVKQSLSDWNPR